MRRSLLLMLSACMLLTMSAAASPGLNYSYYEGNWSTMPDFSALTASETGVSTNMDLGVRNRDTYFGILWQGYINIPANGTYTFELVSDDGSKMWIGNYNNSSPALINNDGLHSSKTVTVSHYLYKGAFPIALTYFQATGLNSMELYWSSNSGLSRQKVPDNAFMNNYTGTVSSFSGLNYSLVQGSYKSMPDFFVQNKAKTGNTSNIDLNIRNGNTQYSILWEGYINIPADGTYTFETNSDDGSKVYLGQYNNGITPLVNNDGEHGTQIRKGTIYLSAGVYPITVTYFQGVLDQVMELYWSSNTGITRQLIPDNAFKSTAGNAGGGGSSGGNHVSYKYYEGAYNNLPDVTAMTPLKTGTSSTFDLGVRNRDQQYVILWQTNITLPANATYTFETNSDDGSKLYLAPFNSTATPLVNNDGLHGQQIRSASTTLNAGLYSLTIVYFQNGGDQVMEAYWSSNAGIARQKIPESALSSISETTTPPVPEPPTPQPPAPPAPPVIIPDLENEPNGTGGLSGIRNFYFSSTTGDDSRSSTQAQSSATPWRTLSKLNAMLPSLQSGDAVLLKRGDVFDGSINVQKSGISISAYGVGNKPVINGFATLGNWVNLGNNIWSSYYPYNGSRINMVTIDGSPREMGRYPNSSEPKKGYLTYDSHTFNAGNLTGSITDNQLPSTDNWTGAELAIRKCRWVIDKCLITSQSGKTFYYNSPTHYTGLDGFGYFIQNHPKTLDQFGEWYFDRNSKNLQVNFAGNNPNNYTVKESVVDILVTMSGKTDVTFDNLTFQGANIKAFEFGSCTNITISNCNILNTGKTAINANFTNNLDVTNCIIKNTNNTALYLGPGVSNSTISNNKVFNTSLFAGMGENSTDAHTAVIIAGTNNTVQYNEIDSIGAGGIKFFGSNLVVKNNLINHFCLTTDDAAGIYTYNNGFTGRKILNNIVVNGIGASDGTDSYFDLASQGIGLDDLTTDVEVTGNSVANCNGRGLGIHNAHELIVKGNTAYNNDMAQMNFEHDRISPNDPVRNATMTDNIFVAKRANQSVFMIRTKDDDIGQFGFANNNYYARPIDDKLTFDMYSYAGSANTIYKKYDLAHWKSAYGYDANSYKSPVSIAPYTINSVSGNSYPNGSFNSNISTVASPTLDRGNIQHDNSTLDGGALRVTYTGGANNPNRFMSAWFLDRGVNQTLVAGRTYRVRFSAKGSQDNNLDFVGTFLSGSANVMSVEKPFKIYNTRGEVELLYTPTVNIPAAYFSIYTVDAAACPTWWIDNFAIEEVYSITYTNPDDYLRFEYNASTTSKTVPLDGVFVDVKNNSYNYSITLAPYTSAVLIRKGSSVVADALEVVSDANSASRTTALSEMATVEKAAALDLKVTPNPAVNRIQLNMAIPQTESGKATLTIYSASGAAVSSRVVSASNQPLTIDVSGLSKGVYTVNLVVGKQIISKRFVKL